MSTATPAAQGRRIQGAIGAAREIRIIPRIDTYPRVIAFVQTSTGKAVLLALSTLGLRYFYQNAVAIPIMAAIAIITFKPEYRRLLLALAPIVRLILFARGGLLGRGANLAVIALGMTLYLCIMRWPSTRFGRRPVAHLLAGFTILLLTACVSAAHSLAWTLLWSAVGALSGYVWFICYALTDRASQADKDFTIELMTFHPLWGSTSTPFPKGAAYLRRIEAQNAEQLAIAQLKGLKLLVWAILLSLLQVTANWFFHAYLRIPLASQALAMSVHGAPVAWHLRWESQILFLFEMTLGIAVMGHRIICVCRLAGFHALRNTYRPLSSTTIAEFFNHFYYYFKELLVDFFFYPAFLRYWKKHRRIRMAFATFSAACFGNAFFHFTRDWDHIRDVGLRQASADFAAPLLYCLLLAAGITISVLRKRGPRSSSFLRGHLLPVCGVLLFYCLINVFEIDGPAYPLLSYLAHLKSLVIPTA